MSKVMVELSFTGEVEKKLLDLSNGLYLLE